MIKKKLKTLFKKTGIHITKQPKYNGSTSFTIQNFSYGVNIPQANYAPWQNDEAFINIYKQAKPYTMVDIYRCFELWELAEKAFRQNPELSLLEVGAWRGGTAAIIAKKLSLLNAKNNFYIADTFEGVVKTTTNDFFYSGGEHKDASEKQVKDLVENIYAECKVLKGIFPEQTSSFMPQNSKFSFCHIDVDVYQSAKDIVEWIWEKLVVGGIIVFDDYGFHYCNGVTTYVNELKQRKDCMVIHNLNGHAVLIKLA